MPHNTYYHIWEIDWAYDVEGAHIPRDNLPKELRIDRDYERDLTEENVADFLSDGFGWLVNGCKIVECYYTNYGIINDLEENIKLLNDRDKILKEKIKKLEEENEKLKEFPKIAMEDAEGDEAMAMCMSLTEKFNNHLEELTNDFEKTMTDILEQLGGVDRWTPYELFVKHTDPIPTNLIEKAKEENKPFPMDKVKDVIEYKIKGVMEIKEKVEDGTLMEKDEWKDEYDFDIDEAGECLEKYEDDELFDLEDLEHKIKNKVDENNEWWKKELMKLLGWDEDEGAKWNSPFNFDVKVRDIMEELEGRLNPSNEERDPETGEVIKKVKEGCELPFPPPKMRDGVWEEGCESVEREEQITKEYIKGYGHPSLSSIKHFVDNYEGENSMVATIKKWIDDDEKLIYGSFTLLLDNACDKRQTKRIGEHIYTVLLGTGEVHKHMEAMRCCYYLVCWFMRQSNNMCISSYGRMVEHYWDGIGDWLA